MADRILKNHLFEQVARIGKAVSSPKRLELLELQLALEQMVSDPTRLVSVSRETLLEQAQRGEVIVIDVRPKSEYLEGHLPFARSMPLSELEQRIAELPADKEIVAYCRGPFCVMSDEAVSLLASRGIKVRIFLLADAAACAKAA